MLLPDGDEVEANCSSHLSPMDFSGNCMPKCCHTHAPTHVTGPSRKLSKTSYRVPRWFCQFLLEHQGAVAAGTHVKPGAWQPGHGRQSVSRPSSFTVGTTRRNGTRRLICDPPSEDVNMSIRGKTVLITLAITLIGTAPAWSQSLVKTVDTDNDGTVDLAEAKSAASKLFDKLDRDHDGTLDRRELRGRLNAKDFAAGDPDNDGTLDKNEFLALVEKRFMAADPDNDGTIDAKELKSAAGRSLVPLLK